MIWLSAHIQLYSWDLCEFLTMRRRETPQELLLKPEWRDQGSLTFLMGLLDPTHSSQPLLFSRVGN